MQKQCIIVLSLEVSIPVKTKYPPRKIIYHRRNITFLLSQNKFAG